MISDQTYLNWQKKIAVNTFFGRFWVFWGIYVTGLLFATGGCLLFFEVGRQAVAAALATYVLARLIVCEIIYALYKKPRPAQRLNFHPPESKIFISWVDKRLDSFPSSHSASLAAISLAFYFYFPALGLVWFIFTILNGLARIVLGYHEVIDVLAGWAIGLVSGLIITLWLAPLLFT